MIFEQEILERWGALEELDLLLPAANVRTGRSARGPMPCATMTREDGQPVGLTNTGDAFDQTVLHIDVWHNDYLEGLAIAEQVKSAFDRCWFTRSDSDEFFRMRRQHDVVEQDADGVWRLGITFLIQVLPKNY